MSEVIFVSPGQSDIVASGPQFGVKYTLAGPDGSRAVFNDPTDADYVGWLSGISGFDSAEIREAADDLIGDDGGVHGEFLYGRRPVTLEGYIDGRPTNTDRNIRSTRLERASNAMRKDSTLRWAVEGGVEQILYVRRQQPLRITGGVLKQFQLAMVASDYRIYAAALQEQKIGYNVTDVSVDNKGTAPTPPTYTVTGPATGIQIQNRSTGEYIVLAPSYNLPADQSLTADVASRTVLHSSGTQLFDKVEFASTAWGELRPGMNNIVLSVTSAFTSATTITVNWRDAWV